MTFAIGIALVALCALTLAPMRRWLRSPTRPRWLADQVNAEFLMMAHLVATVVGVALLANALIG
jgi:hypothetical protein